MNKAATEVLKQLRTVTWDGDLISKDARDKLVGLGFADRAYGYNWITIRGVQRLITLDVL